MGMFSKILNVVVLSLAVAAVFFAKQLHEKRVQLVDRGDQMATVIAKTAEVLDAKSGTTVASDLTTKALNHGKYSELKGLLPKLTTQATNVITQKNTLGAGLREVASTLEVEDYADADFQNTSQYLAKKDELVETVGKIQGRNNGIIDGVIVVGSKIGLTIDRASLKGYDTYTGEINQIANKTAEIKTKSDTLGVHAGAIASILEVSSPKLSGDYASSLKKTEGEVQSFKDKSVKTKSDLASAKVDIKQLKSDVVAEQAKVAEAQKLVKKANTETAKVKKALEKLVENMDPADIVFYEPGQAQTLGLVRGEITGVNKVYGFVTIDIGKETEVTQRIGPKKIKRTITCGLPVGKKLTVCRTLENGEKAFIAEVETIQVNAKRTFANICLSPKAGDIKMGDMVFFSRQALAEIAQENK